MTNENEIIQSTDYYLNHDDEWRKMTGKLPVRMVNDYLFRALLQEDNFLLKALLASLLRIDIKEIISADVLNPIMLGDAIDEKTYILDVRVDLNNEEHLNLEMQVYSDSGWNERSIAYLCRLFDSLNRGKYYTDLKPVRQIAFCNFTVSHNHPEFYSTYKLINEKPPHNVYSNKFILSNVDLTNVDLATEEDREYHLTEWARFFNATSWEELIMLAHNNPVFDNAAADVYQFTHDQMILEQCIAREEYYAREEYLKRDREKKDEQIADQQKQIAEKDKELSAKDEQLSAKDKQLSAKDEQLSAKDEQLSAKDEQLAEKDKQLEEKERQHQAEIELLQQEIAELRKKNRTGVNGNNEEK